MYGMYITLIIFLNGLLPLFICKCDSDAVNIYLSKQNVTGSKDDLTGTCNVTGLSRNEIVLTDTCNSSPVLALVGAYAKYSPWIEYKGCGILKFIASLMQIDFTQMNFSTEPDIFKCYEHCRMNYIKHNYIGFQRNKCLCFYNVDIEIVLCNNTNVTVCGDNQNFICGGRDNVTVIYEIKNQVINSTNNTGECGVVKIDHNQTTVSSMECLNKAAILCFDDGTGTLHAYPDKTDKWETSVQFCLKHDWLISSVQNVMHGSLPNVTEGTYWVSAVRGISFKSLHDDSDECKVVNIAKNKTTFRSMACSNKEKILCFDNGAFTAYPTRKENFNKSVKFCQEQDGFVSSVEDVMNGNLLNVTDGSYWVFTTSRIAVQAFDNDFCVASIIENGKKIKPLVESCDVKLPVTCRAGSADSLCYGTSTEKCDTTTTMENVSVLSQSLTQQNVIIIIAIGSTGFICLVLVLIVLIFKCRNVKNKNYSGNPQHSNHDRKDLNTHVYNTTQGNDVDDLNPTRKEIHVHTMTQDKDYDDVDPSRMEMHVYTTTQAKDYDDLDPSKKEMHVYTTTKGKDYDDLNPNKKEMHVYTTTQAKDDDDLNPNKKEMHVYNTTQDNDYGDLDPNRKETHVYNTTTGKDYDDLNQNRKETHLYTTTQDNTSGYYTTIPADNT